MSSGKGYHGLCWGCGQVCYKAREGTCEYKVNGADVKGRKLGPQKRPAAVPGVMLSSKFDALSSEDDASWTPTPQKDLDGPARRTLGEIARSTTAERGR